MKSKLQKGFLLILVGLMVLSSLMVFAGCQKVNKNLPKNPESSDKVALIVDK